MTLASERPVTYATLYSALHASGLRRQEGSLADGFLHAVGVGYALAGDVEGCAVIHAGANDRQANRDVDAGLEAKHLDRRMSLVVVHRDHRVEVAPSSAEE